MNDLINLDELGIEQPSEDKAITELTSASDYLPSLRVYGSSSTVVKEGKFPQGHFGLYFSANKLVDLGEQIDVLVIHYRPRASIMLSDEQPISFFNPESADFQEIKRKGSIKGKDKPQGYMFGLEYFIWIPSVGQFACFFCGNPTMRRESSNVKGLVGKAATLKIKFIPSKQYGGWHGFETLGCDAPFEVPDGGTIKEVYDNQFANPKDSEVSIIESDGSEPERAR